MTKHRPSTTTTQISVSLPTDLLTDIKAVAGPRGVSGFLADSARLRFKMQRLGEVATDIAQATGGPYTQAELDAADRSLLGDGLLETAA
jgi:hypothetical protein